MRKFVKVLSVVFVCTALLLPCVCCDKTPQNKKPEQVDLSIAGNDISLYTIVFSDNEYSKNNLENHVFVEHDFYKYIAGDVSEKIFDLTGVKPKVSRDTETPVGSYEILIGRTNRTESSIYDENLSVYEYKNKVHNGKLCLGGGYNTTPLTNGIKTGFAWAATNHAFDFVKKYIVNRMIKGISKVDLEEGFEQSGKAELTTIACIGDSITDGSGASNRNVCAYPAAMQRALWKDYIVLNYGYSGRTMRNDLADRYVGTEYFKAAVEHAEHFDMVLLMLGTNDSDRDPVFDEADDNTYNQSALDIAFALENKRDKLEFVVMNCPAYFGGGNSGSAHVRKLQGKLPSLFEEKGYICHFFDMYTFTKYVVTSKHFPDALHPDDIGYSMMGIKLAEVVEEMKGK